MVGFVGIRPKDGAPRIVPATRFDLDQLEKIRRGRNVRVEITYDRSSPHNRWFHKLVGVVADGIDMHPAVLKAELKYKSGLIKQILTSPLFGVAVELDSTRFKLMDEPEFNEFRRTAVEILFKDYLPGVRRKDVYRQVAELTGEPCPW